MHYVVVGGAGFIGSDVIRQLLAENHSVTAIDDLSTGRRDAIPRHPRMAFLHKSILECSSSDFTRPIDGIVHLVAIPSVEESWLNPSIAHECNLSTTVFILELCVKLEIPRFVFASSAAVYGNSTEAKVTENTAPHPISPYALHKVFSEQYAALFAKQFNLSCISLRLFNVYGSYRSSGVIPLFVNCMNENRPIDIFGNGRQTRDFIHVRDVARAFSLALALPSSQDRFTAFNIGTGCSVPLIEIVKTLSGCFPSWAGKIQYNPARPGDIQESEADISKAERHLGFSSSISIERGLQLTIETMKREQLSPTAVAKR